MRVVLTVNGRPWSGEVPVRLTLSDLLRDRLRLTGTMGCEQGACGACTVLADGEAVRSACAGGPGGRDAGDDDRGTGSARARLSPTGGVAAPSRLPCGFCVPGFLASATEILGSGRRYSCQQLRELLGKCLPHRLRAARRGGVRMPTIGTDDHELLVTGRGRFIADLAPDDCVEVRLSARRCLTP